MQLTRWTQLPPRGCCAHGFHSLFTFATGLNWAKSTPADGPTAFQLLTDWSCCLPQERARKTDLDFAGFFTFQKKPALSQHMEVAGKLGKWWECSFLCFSFLRPEQLWKRSYKIPFREMLWVRFGWASSTSFTWQEETGAFCLRVKMNQHRGTGMPNPIPRLNVAGRWKEWRAGLSLSVNNKLLSQLVCNCLTCNFSFRCRTQHPESCSHPQQPNGPSCSIHHWLDLSIIHWGYHLTVTTLLDKENVCSNRAGSNNPSVQQQRGWKLAHGRALTRD